MNTPTRIGARALLRLECERAQVKVQRQLSARASSARIRAIARVAAYISGCAAAIYAWSAVLFGRGLPGAPEATACGLATLLAWALTVDAARRATGAFSSPSERSLDRWVDLAGPTRLALGVRRLARAGAASAPYAWAILLPLGPWIQAQPPHVALRVATVPFLFVLIGHAFGLVWVQAGARLRAAFVLSSAAALIVTIAYLLSLDAALAPWLGWVPTSLLAAPWGVVLDPVLGAVTTLVAVLAAGLMALRADRWALDQVGWGTPQRAAAPSRRSPAVTDSRWPRHAVHFARDARRAALWVRRDWIVAAWIMLPPLVAYGAVATGPLLGIPDHIRDVLLSATTGAWLPWSFLFTSAILAIAFADGIWAGEPRAFWAWCRTEVLAPATIIRSRWAVVALGLIVWFTLLAVLLALGGATAGDVLTHLVLGLSTAAAAPALGILALTTGIRLRIEASAGGRYLRYAGTLAGFAGPPLALAGGAHPVLPAVVSAAICAIALPAAVHVFLGTEFSSADA